MHRKYQKVTLPSFIYTGMKTASEHCVCICLRIITTYVIIEKAVHNYTCMKQTCT